MGERFGGVGGAISTGYHWLVDDGGSTTTTRIQGDRKITTRTTKPSRLAVVGETAKQLGNILNFGEKAWRFYKTGSTRDNPVKQIHVTRFQHNTLNTEYDDDDEMDIDLPDYQTLPSYQSSKLIDKIPTDNWTEDPNLELFYSKELKERTNSEDYTLTGYTDLGGGYARDVYGHCSSQINMIQQGFHSTERIGNKINLRYLKVNVHMRKIHTTSGGSTPFKGSMFIRQILVLDKYPQDSNAPTATYHYPKILSGTIGKEWTWARNHGFYSYSNRYIILFDKKIQTKDNQVEYNMVWSKEVDLTSTWKTSDTTNSYNPIKGDIFLLSIISGTDTCGCGNPHALQLYQNASFHFYYLDT